MAIFQTIAGLINLALRFLFFLMPVWLPLLVVKIRYKKSNNLNIIPTEVQTTLTKFLFLNNKIIWINSAIAIVILFIGYKLVLSGGCEEMGCLAMPLVLAPIILSALIIIIIFVVTLISSITKFYHPNQKKII